MDLRGLAPGPADKYAVLCRCEWHIFMAAMSIIRIKIDEKHDFYKGTKFDLNPCSVTLDKILNFPKSQFFSAIEMEMIIQYLSQCHAEYEM